MFKVLESIDFCIFIRHSLALFSPNSSLILFRTSREYPPNTSTMMLICLTTYLMYLSFISRLSGAYVPIHGHVISMSNTSLFSLSTNLTSTRFDLTTVLSAYTGKSQLLLLLLLLLLNQLILIPRGSPLTYLHSLLQHFSALFPSSLSHAQCSPL